MVAQPLSFLGEIRPMQADDLETVAWLEQRANPFPWTLGIFRDCLRVGYPAWVYTERNAIQAFSMISTNVFECHLLNLCVLPEAQGCGIGRHLLRHTLEVVKGGGKFERMILEVRQSNTRALQLYYDEGFRRIGVRKGYYRGQRGREDAIVLALELLD
mgnify:FL=1